MVKQAKKVCEVKPESFICPGCGKKWILADIIYDPRWDVTVHTCNCGTKNYIRNGKVDVSIKRPYV